MMTTEIYKKNVFQSPYKKSFIIKLRAEIRREIKRRLVLKEFNDLQDVKRKKGIRMTSQEKSKRYFLNPENRKKHLERMREYNSRPEVKARKREWALKNKELKMKGFKNSLKKN